MSIGTVYYSHSTARGQAEFTSMPFHSASITHNRDKASMMTFKSNLKLEEADRIIYKDLESNKTFGGQVVKRSKSLGGDYSYEVMDYTRLYQTKVSYYFSQTTSANLLRTILKENSNELSTSGIQSTNYIHSYLKWDNVSLWTIIEQLAWLEYQAGVHIYYDIDYTGALIWKEIPQTVEGYSFSEAFDYNDTHDSSTIITRGVFINSKNMSQHIDAFASESMLAKWGYITEMSTCEPKQSNKKKTNKKGCKKKSEPTKFWNKCGVSPDGKEIVSVAKPSGPDAGKYHYKLYRTVFENYCPICKEKGYLRFDGGRKTKCITSEGAGGAGYKSSVQAEHEITCVACDSDYCGVTGAEKWYTIRGRLKTIKKPVSSSQKEYSRLTSGKLVYQKGTTSKCETKNNGGSTKNEKNIKKYNIASVVWKKAVEVTSSKNSELKNAKAIFNWIKNHTSYEGYSNSKYGAAGTLRRGKGNCCDHAHLFAAMCRAVGIKCNYIHNSCESGRGWQGHVYNKVYVNGKGIIVDTGRGSPSWGSHLQSGGNCPVEKTSIDF